MPYRKITKFLLNLVARSIGRALVHSTQPCRLWGLLRTNPQGNVPNVQWLSQPYDFGAADWYGASDIEGALLKESSTPSWARKFPRNISVGYRQEGIICLLKEFNSEIYGRKPVSPRSDETLLCPTSEQGSLLTPPKAGFRTRREIDVVMSNLRCYRAVKREEFSLQFLLETKVVVGDTARPPEREAYGAV